jgi:protein-disulfide isomerase
MSSPMASRAAQRRASALRLQIAHAQRQAARRRGRRNLGVVVSLAAVVVVAVAIATSGSGASRATAASGAPVAGAASVHSLLAGIPQHGLVLGDPHAPVRIVEFADLQCPYCDQFATQALPQLVARYLRPGRLSIEFRNLAFIGPDSVRAARAAAGAEEQNELWSFVELMYYNQGEENTGYVTAGYLHRLLETIPGLDVARAEQAGRSAGASGMLAAASAAARAAGVDGTPSFLIGRAGGPFERFQPDSLSAGAFTGVLSRLLSGRGR